MKHLFTSSLAVICFSTYAQFPNLPYNPDENGDGLIGVADLQGLLAYGSEFSSAILSDNGNIAVVEVAWAVNTTVAVPIVPHFRDLGQLLMKIPLAWCSKICK